MIILGVDPGSIRCGYGLIAVHPKGMQYLTSGTLSPSAAKPLPNRLEFIFQGLTDIIRTHHPDHLVVEKIFFAKSVRAALSLGYARAVVLLAAAIEKVDLQERSALEVKKSVVGYGRAEKQQVQKMVRLILNLPSEPSPDSADALALALCYANAIKFQNALNGGRS